MTVVYRLYEQAAERLVYSGLRLPIGYLSN